MKLTTKSILEVLSDEWKPISTLINKLNLTDMYDAQFLISKLKEFKRKNLILRTEYLGKKHWKLNPEAITSENLKAEDYSIVKSRKIEGQIKLGTLGQHSDSDNQYQLYLPLDINYLRSKLLMNIFVDIKPIVGFSLSLKNDYVSIREVEIFHKGHEKLPYCWDIKSNKPAELEVVNQVIEEIHFVPNYLSNQSYYIDRSHTTSESYGILVRNKHFSYGEYELILPLEFINLKNDGIHQSIREMLEEIEILAGFSFYTEKFKNLLVLLDDTLFGFWYDKWNLNQNSFVEDIIEMEILNSGYTIFISYSVEDSERFNIPLISSELQNFPEIQKSLICEKDADDDIIDYMNTYIKKCDILILVCSQNANESYYVKKEWQSAFKLKKKIIPLFENVEDIPPLLTSSRGIEYNENNDKETINKLHSLILRKLKENN